MRGVRFSVFMAGQVVVKRVMAVLAIASGVACGLDFDRYNPDAAASKDTGSGDSDLDAMSGLDAADSGFDVVPAPDAGGSDGAGAGDTGAVDGPACGASGEPCCTGRTCQAGLTCRGTTCH